MTFFTASYGRRAALVLLACSSLCLPIAAAPGAKKSMGKKPSAPPNLSAIIQSPTIQIGDPKLPGKLLVSGKASGFSGASADKGALGSFTQVSVLLYQQGRQAATFDAPVAHINENTATKNVVAVGTGGVVIVSLTEPGTRLTADVVTWYAGLNRIVARGHVVYHNGMGWVIRSPAMTADTRLHSVVTEKGSASGKF